MVDQPFGADPNMLVVDFVTHTQQGRYAPNNGGAAWIEDSSGHWIFTLEIWVSAAFVGELERYTAAGGPNYGASFVTMAPADIVSGATLREHESHRDTWDLFLEDDTPLPDGDYALVIEVSEGTPNQVYELPFTLADRTFTIIGADNAYFTDVRLSLQ